MHFFNVRALAVALALSTFSFPVSSLGQRPPAQPNAAEILHRMQKLQVLGSVLYIVAHPDDENTKLIAWLANGKKVRAGNLSLTRGDGGQNLIGPELGDALGIIRTQELMEARRIDGGEQFFTRAVDFGYSKSADESFEKWGKQEVLSDVVRVIRMFRPDIIITRFPTDGGGGHGHHTASAILAHEAFDMAGDPKAFPEQLEQGLEVWQPRRLFFNGSTWWRKDLAEFAKTDPDWFSVDVGGYDPLLGLSYTEIAGRSRSMHKSQGFGAAETRGEMLEYLHFEKGDRPKTKDIFEGIDMTWGRVTNGRRIHKAIQSLISTYDLTMPEASTESIGKVGKLIPIASSHRDRCASDAYWYWHTYNAISWLYFEVLGLLPEATVSRDKIAIGDSMIVEVRPLARSTKKPELDISLEHRDHVTQNFQIVGHWSGPSDGTQVARFFVMSLHDPGPFWLGLPKSHPALYTVPAPLIGAATAFPPRRVTLSSREPITGTYFEVHFPITHKWIDRIAGERIGPAYETPVASVRPSHQVLLVREDSVKLTVEVEALKDSLVGTLTAVAPESWLVNSNGEAPYSKFAHHISTCAVRIENRDDRQAVEFSGKSSSREPTVLTLSFDGHFGSHQTLHEIDYPHIMPQVYYTPAEVKLIPLDVKVNAQRVGYIKGAGDDVPQAIERMGVAVEMVDPSTATLESITKYDAIVVGIRAYNTEKAMAQFNPVLMKYVENGGTVVAQYNTRSSDMMVPADKIGPYPFQLSRDRVTVEEAPPTFLKRDHPLLKTPNVISEADFEGWVQERGLYFVGEMDPKYTTLIRWNDPGEEPLDGALITCDYGKGRYIYTGISFFRQLPAGVPGAYRLWANLISRREVRK